MQQNVEENCFPIAPVKSISTGDFYELQIFIHMLPILYEKHMFSLTVGGITILKELAMA